MVYLLLLLCAWAWSSPDIRIPALPRRHPSAQHPNLDIGFMLAEVATRLRAGGRTADAWALALHRLDPDLDATVSDSGVPHGLEQIWQRNGKVRPPKFAAPTHVGHRTALTPGGHSTVAGEPSIRGLRASAGASFVGSGRKTSAHTRSKRKVVRLPRGELRIGIPAAITMCSMSFHCGIPTADILDSCAHGVTAASEAAAARSIALAGPKSSARLIALLPLAGFVLSAALGADPLSFMFTTTIGHVCFFVGMACEVAGIVWLRALMRRAEKEG